MSTESIVRCDRCQGVVDGDHFLLHLVPPASAGGDGFKKDLCPGCVAAVREALEPRKALPAPVPAVVVIPEPEPAALPEPVPA